MRRSPRRSRIDTPCRSEPTAAPSAAPPARVSCFSAFEQLEPDLQAIQHTTPLSEGSARRKTDARDDCRNANEPCDDCRSDAKVAAIQAVHGEGI